MSSSKQEQEIFHVDLKTEGYDLRFRHPSSFVIVGSTMSGKTTWVLNVLRNAKALFENPKCTQNVIYFYKIWQEKFDEADRDGLVTEFIAEKPTTEIIIEKTEKYKKDGGSCLIIDDYANDMNMKDIQIFTVLTHHLSCCTFIMSQSLFPKCAAYREISLNCTYNVIFKTTRDFRQFRTFAQQLFPRNWMFLVKTFEEETEKQYSYLLIDHHHATPRLLQIRSHVLPKEFPMMVFLKSKH